MKRNCLRIGVALMLAAASCSSDPSTDDSNMSTVTGGATKPATTTPGAGTAGAGAASTLPNTTGSTTGRGGTGGASASQKPPTGASGAPASTGTTVPNTRSTTPTTSAAAGSSGGNAVAQKAGAGGSTTAAAGSGAPAESSADGFIREAMPTEDSIKKNGEFTVKSYTEREGLIGGDAYGNAANGGDGSALYYPEGAKAPFGP